MKYNFDEPVDRSRNFSAKYDECARKFGREGLIPMWIADMDLKTAQPIMDAMEERNKQGIFGYTTRPASYYEAVCRWQKDRNGYDFDKSLAAFALGVIPAICTIVREFTEPGQEVMYFTPVYSEFHDSVVNSGRTPLTVSLKEQDGYYEIDYEAFEEAAKRRPGLLIMCNPHNPVGRSWTREELEKVGDICVRYQIPIISDEIHSDLMLYGHRHTVMAGVSGEIADITITCTSATKTFNLAACQNSILVIPDQGLRDRYDQYLKRLRINGGNAFGYIAVQSAYEKGRDWLEQVLDIIEANYRYMRNALLEALADVWISELEGTYLMWIDLGRYIKPEDMKHVIQDKCGLAVDYGSWFGEGGYDGFIRVNLATSKENIELAAQNIIRALKHV